MAPSTRRRSSSSWRRRSASCSTRSGKPSASPSFIMPARLAATDPNEQVKEVIGSGPFKFSKDEWQPGNQVVYVRNDDYVPRKEKPSGGAGGKRALVDRVEWRYIPDPATAGAALEAGEVDYWENVPLDFAPRLEKNANLTVFVTDPKGNQGILSAQPPAPAIQQQEGPAGAAARGGPEELHAGGDRQREVLQDLPAASSCAAGCRTRRRPGRPSRTWSAPSSCSRSRATTAGPSWCSIRPTRRTRTRRRWSPPRC